MLHQRLQVKSLLTHVHLHVDDRTTEAQNYMFKSLCSGGQYTSFDKADGQHLSDFDATSQEDI